MSGHAFLAPSGASQWGPGRCPGSARLQAQFPEPSGAEAMEGDVAHWFAAESLLGRTLAVGALHANGLPVTVECVEATEEYRADCQGVMAQADQEPGAFYQVERRVYMHQTVSPHNDGTPDFHAVFPARRLVVLKDYKHGHGYVSAFRNFQLIDYLLGIFETYGLGVPDDTWTIEAAIYQPRNYHPDGHVRYWRPRGSELATWAQSFALAAQEALNPQAVCRVGDWCRYCTAAHACVTLQEAASFAMGHANRAQVHIPDAGQLGRELKAIKRNKKLLTAREEALEEQALALVATGQRVPGWTGKYRSGRWAWSVTVDRVIAFCKWLGADATKPATLTPQQVCKQFGLTREMIESITETPTTFALVEVTQDELAKGLSENGRN